MADQRGWEGLGSPAAYAREVKHTAEEEVAVYAMAADHPLAIGEPVQSETTSSGIKSGATIATRLPATHYAPKRLVQAKRSGEQKCWAISATRGRRRGVAERASHDSARYRLL